MILYKYLTPDRVDVLRDMRIRYTQPRVFNELAKKSPAEACLQQAGLGAGRPACSRQGMNLPPPSPLNAGAGG
jgi:hypothetical protein